MEKHWKAQTIDSLIPDTLKTKFVKAVESLMEDYYYKLTDLELNAEARRISLELKEISQNFYVRELSAKIEALIKECNLVKLHDTNVFFGHPSLDGIEVEAYVAEQNVAEASTRNSWVNFRHSLSYWDASYWLHGLGKAHALAEKEIKKKDTVSAKRVQRLFEQPVVLPEDDDLNDLF